MGVRRERVGSKGNRIADRLAATGPHHVVLVHHVLAEHPPPDADIELMWPPAIILELVGAVSEPRYALVQGAESRLRLPRPQQPLDVSAVGALNLQPPRRR